MASQPTSRRETSLIARVRLGSPCRYGAYTTAMIIAETLYQYRDIISVGFSSNNYVIGLSAPDIQLAALKTRVIEGPGVTLDMVPWCSEYESFNLPWIIKPIDERITLIPPKQPKIYIKNLFNHGLPLHQYAHTLIRGQQSITSISDDSQELGQIPIDGLSNMGKMISMPDFSYLMILELKEFYVAKFMAFRNCAQLCQDLCDCAYQLSKNLDPVLQSIYTHTELTKDAFKPDMQFIIAGFGADVHSQGSYITEELIGITHNMCSIYNNMAPMVCLKAFKRKHQLSLDNVPATYASRLKIILDVVVHRIYGTPVIFTSETTVIGNIITQISAKDYNECYKSAPMIPEARAEADTIYKFLRHKTNVLGYNIIDLNYPILASLVTENKKYNEDINELLLYATQAATMMQQVHKDTTQAYENLEKEIPWVRFLHLDTLVLDLLAITETYSMAAEHGLHIFRQNKETYESIALQTNYRSTPAR